MDLLINHYDYIFIIIIIITSEHFETPWENSLSYMLPEQGCDV